MCISLVALLDCVTCSSVPVQEKIKMGHEMTISNFDMTCTGEGTRMSFFVFAQAEACFICYYSTSSSVCVYFAALFTAKEK